jgi:multidrug efflux pump subunit AcrB
VSLTEFAIEKRAVSYFAIFILGVGGAAAFSSLGQLEDPDFSVKTALVVTQYPGASPHEVELEVTDRIEKAIQEMPQIKDLYSTSTAGVSTVRVDILDEYWADRLPQVWDELRNKVDDVAASLPPGAGAPQVIDDFSFVYGFVLAVTGDGFSKAELDDYIDLIRKELALVPGVARAEPWGIPDKVVYVDASQAQLSELNMTGENIAATLAQQNMVVDAGHVDVQSLRYRIAPTGEFRSADEIGELQIRPTLADVLTNLATAPAGDAPASDRGRSDELIRIRDIATITQTTLEPPRWEMRWNGQYAQGISLANITGGNIVDTGRALDARLAELVENLPVGIEVHKVAWQSDLVATSVREFLVNLIQAIVIVLAVLTIPMGWRMGVIIGGALLFTILGTFLVMAILGIDLHRMSLGALVIALGMMVDNAIVVSDGIFARLQGGMDRKRAAIESATSTAWPLLGATVVAVMAFYPIFASTANAGEYCRTLFTVVAISLLLSWLIAMTLTPLQCMDMLKVEAGKAGQDAYGGRFYQTFRRQLAAVIRARLLFMGATGDPGAVRLGAPRAPGGVAARERARRGRRRLPGPGPAALLPAGRPRGRELLLRAAHRQHPRLRRRRPPGRAARSVGPADAWKFEARFSGPGEADFATLRELAGRGLAALRGHPMVAEMRTDMRQRVQKVVPDYLQERARWADVSREDIARSTKRAFDGMPIGLFREGRDLYPIFLRNSDAERETAAADMDNLQVQRTLSTETVPMSAVANLEVEWEDPIIVRWNRRRAITVQATPKNATFPTLEAAVLPAFDAIELPPGYELFWDGERYSTDQAQKSLVPGMIPAGVIILFIIVALFNAFRPPIVILLTIPFAIIGITLGRLATGSAFGFVALLGAMSLAGMMIKNAIVLLDQIGTEISGGKSRYQAVVDSAVSRLRPVALAAATTVLGVIPLLQDVFWVSMAVTIMAGLSFGTILTMVVVPVLYCILYKVPSPERP